MTTSIVPGLRLAQYEILQPIGAGGMGEVYRARDARLGRDVAIKVMSPHVASDEELRRRFEVEARSVAALSHPNILAIYELAKVDDLSFAVMELLEGETLRERLTRGSVPWREAVEIAASVADGLAAAHARGIVHRDLKPENLFLTAAGAVKILDFGLALHRPESSTSAPTLGVVPTAAGVVLGTFGYLSPEQALGHPVDGRSDIFALGCVLYEMLSGKRLFAGSTPQEILARLLNERALELSGFDPLAPSELRLIVTRAVDRDPARRFESARDFTMALRALLTGSAARAAGARPRPRGKSLAVLPFLNAGADPQLEYLADGITESIINSLSQLPGVRIVPRSLAFRYKDVQSDPATIGLALDARTILTGRVLQRDGILNIQAELVDTATESQLWGEQFRRPVDDVLAIQEQIAWQISEALRLRLTSAQRTRLRRRPTVNTEAYHEYLRGRYHWNRWTIEGFRRALGHFERAIEHDPLYAAGYAGLGDTLGAMGYYHYGPAHENLTRARAAALKAIELDPKLADPHVTLAIVDLFHMRDWAAAERDFERALKLDPKLARAHCFYALQLSSMGRHEEALQFARRGLDLEPLSQVVSMGVAWTLYFAGRHEDALREAMHTAEISSAFEEAPNMMMSCFEALGRYEAAADLMTRYPSWGLPLDGDRLREAFQTGGASAYWQERYNQTCALGPETAILREHAMAVAAVQLGKYDDAFELLEQVNARRAGILVFFMVDSWFAPLRDDPRFAELAARIGIPATPLEAVTVESRKANRPTT